MQVKVEEIVRDVLRLMDENEDILQEKIEFGIAGTNLVDLIREEIEPVAAECILSATSPELNESKEYEADVEWEGIGRGRVILPSDFLRLIRFRMSDWDRSVTRFMEYGGEAYSLRFHPRSGRRGIRSSPAVAIQSEGSDAYLEFVGSTDPGTYVERFSYIPRPVIAPDDTICIPSGLFPRVARTCAQRLHDGVL